MSVTTYPDGSVLTSTTAFTPLTMNIFFQRLTATILGYTPASDSDSSVWKNVRVDWVPGGQPAFGIADDVVFLKAIESDDPFGRYRSKEYLPGQPGDTTVTMRISYTRVWEMHWTAYGPNCFDRARQIKDAILTGNYCFVTLAQSNLFTVNDVGPLRYAREAFQGQWWDRTDLQIRINEAIVETQTLAPIASLEVDIVTETGVTTEIINAQ